MNQVGVVFDLDGTLADTLPDIAAAVNAGLAAFDLPAASVDSVRGWVGEGLPTLCRRAAGGAEVSVDEMVRVVSAHYRAHRLDQTRAFAGIPELLDALTGLGIPFSVCTNKPHAHTAPIVEALFARWSFVAVEGYRVEDRRKPDPRTTIEIIERMECIPSRVLFVGDSATDIETSLNAGALPVGVTWGYRNREELEAAGAIWLIDHPQRLFEAMQSLPGGE